MRWQGMEHDLRASVQDVVASASEEDTGHGSFRL